MEQTSKSQQVTMINYSNYLACFKYSST